ncbi:hypothetical protein [Pseudomonas syringae]|nr:hypothetical protein [Pseudomonas syringae]
MDAPGQITYSQFPPIENLRSSVLPVGELHTLYRKEIDNPVRE